MKEGEQELEGARIPLSALEGDICPETGRLVGKFNEQSVPILLDTGSNLSFINTDTAVLAKVAVSKTKPLVVTVANGQRVFSEAKRFQVKWEVQGHQFVFDLRMMKLGAYYVVLGVDWLSSISPFSLDLNNLTRWFSDSGKGCGVKGSSKVIQGQHERSNRNFRAYYAYDSKVLRIGARISSHAVWLD